MAIDKKTWLTAAITAGIALSVGVPIAVSIGAALLAGGTQAFLSWLFPSNPQPQPSASPPPSPARGTFFDEVDGDRDRHVYHHHIEHNSGPDFIFLGKPSPPPPPSYVPYVAPGRLYPDLRGNNNMHLGNPPVPGSIQQPPAAPVRPDGSQRVGTEFRPAAGAHNHQIGDTRPDGAKLADRRFEPKAPSTQPPAPRPLTFSPAAAASSQNNNSRQTFLNHRTPSTPYQTPAPTRADGATRVNAEIRSANTQHQVGDTRPDGAQLVGKKFIRKQ